MATGSGGGASSSVFPSAGGAAAPPSSIRGRSRKRRSLVWSYFVHLPSAVPGSEDDRAMCRRCEAKLRTGGKHGTSHLTRHIYICFQIPPDQPLPLLPPRPPPPPPPPPSPLPQGVQVSPAYAGVDDVLDLMNQLADDFDDAMRFPGIDHNNDPNTSFEDSEGLVNSYLSEDVNDVVYFPSPYGC